MLHTHSFIVHADFGHLGQDILVAASFFFVFSVLGYPVSNFLRLLTAYLDGKEIKTVLEDKKQQKTS